MYFILTFLRQMYPALKPWGRITCLVLCPCEEYIPVLLLYLVNVCPICAIYNQCRLVRDLVRPHPVHLLLCIGEREHWVSEQLPRGLQAGLGSNSGLICCCSEQFVPSGGHSLGQTVCSLG